MAIDVEALYDRRADNRWDRMSVGDIFERMTHSDPDKVAIVAALDAAVDPRYARLTYREADRLANRVANALIGEGLQRGDRVAMLCENSPEAYVTKIAIAKAGMVAFPINTLMADDMVEHMLRLTEARVAIVDHDAWDPQGGPLRACGITPLATLGPTGTAPDGIPDLEAWLAGASPDEPSVRIHGDDIWEIISTSGTTALPKAVMVSHTYSYMAAMAHGMSYSRGLPIECDLISCSFLPVLFHIGDHAHVLPSMLSGGRAVIGRTLDPALTAATVQREGVTALWGGSPQFLRDLMRTLDADPYGYDMRSVSVIIYGWSAMSPELVARFQERCDGVHFVGIFGQTEAIACHRFWPAKWPELHRRTAPEVNYVGVPTPLLGSSVVDEDMGDLRDRPGVPGEAVYRSPAISSGYYRDRPATEAAFRAGWFHSGDMCAYDENGLRIMIDRYKDVVKSGGENVSSIRVETVLMQHPAVVGLPDGRWGEMVTGVIVLAAGVSVDSDALIAFCRSKLAGYETPKRIVTLNELPVTVGGKVLKYKLREMLQ